MLADEPMSCLFQGRIGILARMRLRRNPGFTLVEVLIALMVLAVGLTCVFALFAAATRSHKRAVDSARAALLARKVFAEKRALLYNPDPPTGVNDLSDPDFPDLYTYDIQLLPLSNDRDTFLMRVRVKWKVQGREESEIFESMVSRKPDIVR